MGAIRHDHLVDIQGLCCSAPVIRLTKEFRTRAPGEVVLVISDKSSMMKDIPSYCRMTGNELLRQEERDGLLHFWIIKR